MKSQSKARNLVLIALMAALTAVCAWITVPATVPFTLQTFAVFLCVSLLGGKRGLAAVAVYLLLGALGAPVFAGFSGGPGVLLGPTGGYLIGFLFTALVMWGFEKLPGSSLFKTVAAMAVGLAVCYAFGTAWFLAVAARNGKAVKLSAALSWCVLPFLLPDAAKIALATLLARRVKRFVP